LRSFNSCQVLKEREPERAGAVVMRRALRLFSCLNYGVKQSSALATAARLPAARLSTSSTAGLRPSGLGGVLLWLLIELPLALIRAEEIVRALIL
jgi:hypothetical protein